MKCQVTRILSIGIALVTVAAVQAQDKTVTANVPFNFYIGSKAMSQGAYTVAEFWHGAVVALRSADGATSVTTHEVTSNQRFEPAKLVFHRYGDSYFLAEIWTGDGNVGQSLAVSSREKELAHSGAMPTLALIRLALHQ
jgi:hypothetical protein